VFNVTCQESSTNGKDEKNNTKVSLKITKGREHAEDLGISEMTTKMCYEYARVRKMDIYWLRVDTKVGLLGIPNKIWGSIKGK
jgi:hypothetical protein